jgi:hypothetical protein
MDELGHEGQSGRRGTRVVSDPRPACRVDPLAAHGSSISRGDVCKVDPVVSGNKGRCSAWTTAQKRGKT